MRTLLAMAVVSATVAGCGGGSMSEPAAPPAQPSGINFTTFTEALLRIQSEAGQPAAVTSAQFVYPDNDNPQAFAAVLPAT
jgi:hypothetical protein